MMRIFLLLLLLVSVSGSAQMDAKTYYSIHYRCDYKDTLGVYQEIFTAVDSKDDFYHTLAKGYYYFITGVSVKAVDEYTHALMLAGKNDTLSALASYKIGYLYFMNDNYLESLKYLNQSSLVVNFQPRNFLQAKLYVHIGLVHHFLGSLSESEKCYRVAMDFYRAKGDERRLAATQNNLALSLLDEKKFDEAHVYLDSCMMQRKKAQDHMGMGQTYNNFGTLYYDQGEYKIALANYNTGYQERIIGKAPKSGLIESQINIGKTYRKLGDIQNAIYWLEQGLAEGKMSKNYELLRRVTEELKDIYALKGEYKSAFEMQELYYTTKDSLYGYDKRLAIENLSLQNRFEMKIRQDSISNAQTAMTEKMMADEKEKRSRLIVYSLCGGLLFLSFFIFQLYKSNLNKKKANALIVMQKEILDQKQKEILDSINYAKKIQYALLAHSDLLKKNLPAHFIFFKPKDIVSGDFYWATEKNSGSGSLQDFYFAICDSTGHGVPGAFMSLLNTSFLNEAVNEKNIVAPNQVFNHVRQRLIENISHEGARDGMDGILLKMRRENSEVILEYSAANNAPLVIRNKEALNLPFDKMPVGKGHKDEAFNLYTFRLQKNDLLYLFTDGYADQFGGENTATKKAGGKKFKKANLIKLLIEISHLPLEEQMVQLEQQFITWCGDLEQVDDVCVVGVRV